MAFAPEQEEEEKKESSMGVLQDAPAAGAPIGASVGAPGSSPQGIDITGESAFTGGTGEQADISQTPDQEGASGQFQNIGQYLEANKQAAQRLGEKVGERFQQRGENLQQSLAGRRSAILGQQGKISQEAGRLGAGEQFIGEQISQAQQGKSANEEALKRFSQFRTGYDPRITPSLSKEQQRVSDITKQARALATRRGRFGELQDVTRGASRGEQSLDRALLALSKPEALRPERLQDVSRRVGTKFSALQSDVAAKQAENLTQRQALEKTAAERLTGEEGALTQFRSDLEGRMTSEQERVAAEDKSLREAFGKSTDFTPQDFARMGVSPENQKEFAALYAKAQARSLEQKLRGGPEVGTLTDEDFRRLGFKEDQYKYGREQFANQAYRDKLLAAAQGQGDLGKSVLAQRTGDPIYGGLEQYIRQPGPQDITAATVSTPEQFAQSQALARLAGVDPRLQQANLERAGISGQYGGQLDHGSALAALQARFPNYVPPEDFSYTPASYDPGQEEINPYSGTGSLVGAGIGYMYGGPLGAGVGAAAGHLADPLLTAGHELTEGILNLGQDKGVGSAIYRPVIQTVAKVARRITRIFCFVAGTLVKMKDGSFKKIENIKPNDEVFLGGKVYGSGSAIANDNIYKYRDTFVTGQHTVFENGKWLNVEDTDSAVLTDLPTDTIVYPLYTDEHIMVTNDFISADIAEVDDNEDGSHGSMTSTLDILNNDTKRNEWLQEEADKLMEKSDENKKLSA